jgi:hypothetical protein
MLLQSDEHRAEELLTEAKKGVKARWEHYQDLAAEPHHNGNDK